jgi:hypothetical protein
MQRAMHRHSVSFLVKSQAEILTVTDFVGLGQKIVYLFSFLLNYEDMIDMEF